MPTPAYSPLDPRYRRVQFLKALLMHSRVGVAYYQANDNEQSLMRRVDQALYAAKAQGRNRTVTDVELDATPDQSTPH